MFLIPDEAWVDASNVGNYNGREQDAANKFNEMLDMLASYVDYGDMPAWVKLSTRLRDEVIGDTALPDLSPEEIRTIINNITKI